MQVAECRGLKEDTLSQCCTTCLENSSRDLLGLPELATIKNSSINHERTASPELDTPGQQAGLDITMPLEDS